MLITKKITTKWNSKTKKYYESLGYHYTKIGDPLVIDVKDLKDGSNERVTCKCDYCGKEYSIAWYSYINLKKKKNNKDCCNDPDCTSKKAIESMIMLHGVENARYIDEVNRKIENTNMKKYGSKNPFSNSDIKEKIVDTNIKKYGVPYPMQNDAQKIKAQNTCMNRYGVPNYGAIYSKNHRGSLSPSWKGGVRYHRVERSTYEYRMWRKSVFSRDLFTCQCCGDKSRKGHPVELHAHHIKNWMDNISDRYNVDNGITLCDKCHYAFHSIYGKSNNDEEQIREFLNHMKKVC